MIAAVSHHNIALPVERDAAPITAKLPWTAAFAAYGAHVSAVVHTKHLNTAVVTHEHVSAAIDNNARGTIELPVSTAFAADGCTALQRHRGMQALSSTWTTYLSPAKMLRRTEWKPSDCIASPPHRGMHMPPQHWSDCAPDAQGTPLLLQANKRRGQASAAPVIVSSSA
jgi:hypothetical protein